MDLDHAKALERAIRAFTFAAQHVANITHDKMHDMDNIQAKSRTKLLDLATDALYEIGNQTASYNTQEHDND